MPNPLTASFPSALATQALLGVARNNAHSTLASGIDDSTLSIPVVSGAVFADPCLITIGSETIAIASRNGNTLTASARAVHGSAAAHDVGMSVDGYVDENYHNRLAAEVLAIETALGVNLANVVRYVDGKVGIGNTTPAALFDIGIAAFSNSLAANTLLMIRGSYISGSVDDQYGVVHLGVNGDANYGALFAVRRDVSGNVHAQMGVRSAGANYWGLNVAPNGNVGIGTSSPIAKLHVVADQSYVNPLFASYWDVDGALVVVNRYRGSVAAPAALLANDRVGGFLAGGAVNATTIANLASIEFAAAENFAPGATGTRMTFWTTAVGTTGRAERMRISDAGNVGIGTANPGMLLDLSSNTPFIRFTDMDQANKQWQMGVSNSLQGFVISETGIQDAIILRNGGHVVIGGTAQVGPGSPPASLVAGLPGTCYVTHGAGNYGLVVTAARADAGSANLTLYHTRAADAGTKAALVDGDLVGLITIMGATASDTVTTGAQIATTVSGAVSQNILPMKLVFRTMNVAGAMVDALTILPSGNVGICATGPLTTLQVSGASTVPTSEQGTLLVTGGGAAYRLALGYDSANDYGWIQAVHNGVGNKPLKLNVNGWGAGGSYVVLGCPVNWTPTTDLPNSSVSFSLNESAHLLSFCVRYSSGALRVGTVSLAVRA